MKTTFPLASIDSPKRIEKITFSNGVKIELLYPGDSFRGLGNVEMGGMAVAR